MNPQDQNKLYMVIPEPKGKKYYSDQRVRYYSAIGYVRQYAQSLEYQKREYQIFETDVDWKLVASAPSEEIISGE